MPKPAAKPARARRTRAEVQEELASIQKETAAAQQAADAKAAEFEKARDAEIRESVAGVSVQSVVRRMSELSVDVNRALAGLSEQLVEEVNRLEAVRQAVELERAELERLHKIDIAATALDQLMQEHRQMEERLNAEIAAKRDAWEEEARSSERERKEQEELLRKQRQREIDEYEYKKALERKKAQDKYDEELRLAAKHNQERQEALERDWRVREEALKARETEYERVRKEAEEFPARLRAATEQAAGEAARAAEARLEQQLASLKKDAEIEKRLAEMQAQTLEGIISRQREQIEALQKQVDLAKQQVQDIAVKAIEGASGSKALSHVNQIAIEQAKNRPQS